MKFTLIYKSTVLIVLIAITISCNTKKASKTKDLQNAELEINYLNKGYVRATIVHIESADEVCSFLIKLENGNLLEPLTLSDNFKVNNTSIWLKYIQQRRPSRCSAAIPVEIIEIVKSE